MTDPNPTRGRPTVMRVMRERAGLSQEELGRRVGCRQPSISEWENGLSSIPTARKNMVARELGVDPARLGQAWDDFLLDGGASAL